MAHDVDVYKRQALDVARQQVENGAQIIDINMDEGMLDAEAVSYTHLTDHHFR